MDDGIYLQIVSFNASAMRFNVTRPEVAPHQLLTSMLNATLNGERAKLNAALRNNPLRIPASWGADHFPTPRIDIDYAAPEMATAM